jgi:hypothetical protein
LHDLETDRATIKLLADKVSELARSIDDVATRAAVKAITAALEHRSQLRERRLDFRAKLLGAGVGVDGFAVVLVQHLHA